MANGMFGGQLGTILQGIGMGLLSDPTPTGGIGRGLALAQQMQRGRFRDQIDAERLAMARQQLAQAGQITPYQQAQLDLQRDRLALTPQPLTFDERMQLATAGKAQPLTFDQRMQLAQAGRAPQETAEDRARATQRVKQEGERATLRRGGQQVLNAVQGLRSKVGRTGPGATASQRAAADRFESATGPLEGTVLGGGLNPLRSSENLTTLRQVQQDAQAINTQMQRALLRGGGQITENEREQINQILGSIATARNANQAAALLDNFENIVRGIFDMGEASGTVSQAQSTGVINFNDLPE